MIDTFSLKHMKANKSSMMVKFNIRLWVILEIDIIK